MIHQNKMIQYKLSIIIIAAVAILSQCVSSETIMHKTPWMLAQGLQPDGSPSYTGFVDSGYPDIDVCGTTRMNTEDLQGITVYNTTQGSLWTNLTSSDEQTQSVVVDDFYRLGDLTADYPGMAPEFLVNLSSVEFAFALWTQYGPGVVKFTQMRWIKVPTVSQQFPNTSYTTPLGYGLYVHQVPQSDLTSGSLNMGILQDSAFRLSIRFGVQSGALEVPVQFVVKCAFIRISYYTTLFVSTGSTPPPPQVPPLTSSSSSMMSSGVTSSSPLPPPVAQATATSTHSMTSSLAAGVTSGTDNAPLPLYMTASASSTGDGLVSSITSISSSSSSSSSSSISGTTGEIIVISIVSAMAVFFVFLFIVSVVMIVRLKKQKAKEKDDDDDDHVTLKVDDYYDEDLLEVRRSMRYPDHLIETSDVAVLSPYYREVLEAEARKKRDAGYGQYMNDASSSAIIVGDHDGLVSVRDDTTSSDISSIGSNDDEEEVPAVKRDLSHYQSIPPLIPIQYGKLDAMQSPKNDPRKSSSFTPAPAIIQRKKQ